MNTVPQLLEYLICILSKNFAVIICILIMQNQSVSTEAYILWVLIPNRIMSKFECITFTLTLPEISAAGSRF